MKLSERLAEAIELLVEHKILTEEEKLRCSVRWFNGLVGFDAVRSVDKSKLQLDAAAKVIAIAREVELDSAELDRAIIEWDRVCALTNP